ncbi:hypothetical protein FBU31_007083 [Coemansia sp. 'formosensis']|nr:hypothetical protein FBU31_007083 [Coemansia sp. 'formosensis']
MAPFRHGRAPVVLVGGSFAGSLIVWTKQRYPDFESFAIASSAPLKIVDGYWEFDRMVAGRLPCAKTLSLAVRTIDEILDREDSTQTAALKRRFGLEHVENDADFVAALAIQVSALMQSAQNKGSIAGYCSQIEPPSAKAVDGVEALARVTREYGRFHRIVPVGECPGRSDDLAWLWQQCTELGMWQTAPSPNSSVVAEAAWFAHRLRSRRLDVGHYRRQCDKCLPLVRNNQPAYRKAQFRIFARRTLDSYTRWVPSDALLTAGDLDPWLHLTAVWGGGRRTDNTLLIGNASHAEDLLSVAENGSENPEVRNARNRIIQAVEQWSLKHKQRAEHQGYRHALLVIGSGGIQIGAAFAVLCALVAKYAL